MYGGQEALTMYRKATMKKFLVALAILAGVIGVVLMLLGETIGIVLAVIGLIGGAFTIGGRAGSAG
jgi:hypothetical protein